MNKAKRIKTLEGYTQSLEERIEKLESWNMLAPVEQGELRKLQRAVERSIKLGIRDPKEAKDYTEMLEERLGARAKCEKLETK